MLFVAMRSRNHREQLIFLQSLVSSLFLLSVTCHAPSRLFFPISQLLIRIKTFPDHHCSQISVFRIYFAKKIIKKSSSILTLDLTAFTRIRKKSLSDAGASEHTPIPSENYLASLDCLEILAYIN